MNDWAQNKEDYRKFCRSHGELPVFFQDWWLDAVCGEDWNVCLSRDKGKNIQGVLPFYQSTYWGLRVIKMPDLTPYLGVWLHYPTKQEKWEAVYRFEKKMITELLQQLPRFAYYAQCHPPQLKNGLPFHWEGFKQETRFSYCLSPVVDETTLFNNLKGSVRTELRKAEAEINIVESEDIQLFYQLQEASFERQSKPTPYRFEFLSKIDTVLKEKQQRKLLIAKDQAGNPHAGIYLLWDEHTVYNLLQGADPQFGNSGAIKKLLWEGILLAHRQQKSFDFEGGMMKNIEPVFSAFGGTLRPYFRMYKGGNKLFRLLSAIRNG